MTTVTTTSAPDTKVLKAKKAYGWTPDKGNKNTNTDRQEEEGSPESAYRRLPSIRF